MRPNSVGRPLVLSAHCILSVTLVGVLVSCGTGLGPTAPPAPGDCATLSQRTDWAVEFFLQGELQVEVGKSKRVSVGTNTSFNCPGAIASVAWVVQAPTVVSITPQAPLFGWLTGLQSGLTSVTARLAFSDGVERVARPRDVRVVQAQDLPAGSRVVVEGTVDMEPPPPLTLASFRYIPFTTTAPGQIDVFVDWTSPLNSINFSGYEGNCSATVPCGMIRMIVRMTGAKPLLATFDNPRTPPGDYTVRIDNLGPGAERVSYEVRLTPN